MRSKHTAIKLLFFRKNNFFFFENKKSKNEILQIYSKIELN